MSISIHALLAESDSPPSVTPAASRNFYPRSPCGERPRCRCWVLSDNHFYPRSPCGERRVTVLGIQHRVGISIHALLAESDYALVQELRVTSNFYPRSPCGERRSGHPGIRQRDAISIHALLAESDAKNTSIAGRITSFLSTLSLRRATMTHTQKFCVSTFLSTLSLRRATCCSCTPHSRRIRFLSTLSLRRATAGPKP